MFIPGVTAIIEPFHWQGKSERQLLFAFLRVVRLKFEWCDGHSHSLSRLVIIFV